MSSPARLTLSDMCPIAPSLNRLTSSTMVTRKSYGPLTQSYAPFSGFSSLLVVSEARFAKSHIYIYLHKRCTVSTVMSI